MGTPSQQAPMQNTWSTTSSPTISCCQYAVPLPAVLRKRAHLTLRLCACKKPSLPTVRDIRKCQSCVFTRGWECSISRNPLPSVLWTCPHVLRQDEFESSYPLVSVSSFPKRYAFRSVSSCALYPGESKKRFVYLPLLIIPFYLQARSLIPIRLNFFPCTYVFWIIMQLIRVMESVKLFEDGGFSR